MVIGDGSDGLNPEAVFRSRREILPPFGGVSTKCCEGGCGVIGIIGSEPLVGGLIIRSCEQMNNRGNGKGGGVAAVGLFPSHLKDHYALHLAFINRDCRRQVEREFLYSVFDVTHSEQQTECGDFRSCGLEICPPQVFRYFVRVKPMVLKQFMEKHEIASLDQAEDEFVFQNSFRLNRRFYAEAMEPAAFVLSHGKDLMILKAVGFAEQVARYYKLEKCQAHVWIGHQRYPTRGKVWHPGGAHPFAGLHEALVHNGDFANYHSVTEYLRQYQLAPLFVTDTEVSALLFDLYARTFSYPLEYVIEALAPTPQGDFQRLSKTRQRIYRAIQSAHFHGSPDGPWFFIIARNDPKLHQPQLIGITDVSMLRPQVFAYQRSATKSFAAIASEKQAIDAFFADLAVVDPTVLPIADHYWNARGGSFSDGGAFCFSLVEDHGVKQVKVVDKFGKPISDLLERQQGDSSVHQRIVVTEGQEVLSRNEAIGERRERLLWWELAGRPVLQQFAAKLQSELSGGHFENLSLLLEELQRQAGSLDVLATLTFLRDRIWDTEPYKRSEILVLVDQQINLFLDRMPSLGEAEGEIRRVAWRDAWLDFIESIPKGAQALALDACGFPPEGDQAVCRLIVKAHKAGWKRIIVYHCHGDRFIGCGLGPDSSGLRLDVYGSSGDYLASGIDGAEVYVHGSAQDQVGQILKSGRIVVFGDVGQTLLYGAKGGEVFIRGNAAGRPLINSVGKIRAVINGTCLDYCAESFMAGRETGDGFVIINGIAFDRQGVVIGLEDKYSGNNLFSLASGGACYLNDPYHTVKPAQLNGGRFAPFRQEDWNLILEYLRLNEYFFGISIRRDLLLVDGVTFWPKEIFRKIVPSRTTARLDWSSMPD